MTAATYYRMTTRTQASDWVAIYARSATENGGLNNVDSQVEQARHYCLRQRLVVFGVYTDESKSGLTPLGSLPGGAALFEDTKYGMFNIVIVTSLDRISRNPVYLTNILHQLASLDIRVVSIDGTYSVT